MAAVVICCGAAGGRGSAGDQGSWATPRNALIPSVSSGVALLLASRDALDLAGYSCVFRAWLCARTGRGATALVGSCDELGCAHSPPASGHSALCRQGPEFARSVNRCRRFAYLSIGVVAFA